MFWTLQWIDPTLYNFVCSFSPSSEAQWRIKTCEVKQVLSSMYDIMLSFTKFWYIANFPNFSSSMPEHYNIYHDCDSIKLLLQAGITANLSQRK
jgi:hypothetical protein